MKRLEVSVRSNISMRCSSSLVPSVTVTRACVSPRVNSAEPCVRGSTPTSQSILRISSNARPSGRRLAFSISSRKMRSFSVSNSSLASACCFLGQRLHHLLLGFVDAMIAFELGILLGVERVGQLLADLRLDLRVQLLVDRRPAYTPLLLASLGHQFLDPSGDFLAAGMAVLDGLQHFLFGGVLRARLPPSRCLLRCPRPRCSPWIRASRRSWGSPPACR